VKGSIYKVKEGGEELMKLKMKKLEDKKRRM
jgi:hypothetical protein